MLILGLLTVIYQTQCSKEVEGHQHTNCLNFKTRRKIKLFLILTKIWKSYLINKMWESNFLPGILLCEIKKHNVYGTNAEYREFHVISAMETHSTESICPSDI